MRRTVTDVVEWWPVIALVVAALLFRSHEALLLPMLGAVLRPPVLYVWDPVSLRFTYADPECIDQLGYTPEELHDLRLPDLTGRPADEYDAVSNLLTRGIAAAVKLTGMARQKDTGLWQPMLSRHTLMVTEAGPPQILAQARVMTPTELTCPSAALSLT